MDQARSAREKFQVKNSITSALPLANSANFPLANSAYFPLANSANSSLLLDTMVSESNVSQVAAFDQKGHEIPKAFAGAPTEHSGGRDQNERPAVSPLVQPETHKGGP